MTATWRETIVATHGACAPPTDPRAWDLGQGWSLTEENRLAIRICRERCPVQAACALETLAAPEWPWGTIRAGVPLRWADSGTRPSPRSLTRLQAVADGAP